MSGIESFFNNRGVYWAGSEFEDTLSSTSSVGHEFLCRCTKCCGGLQAPPTRRGIGGDDDSDNRFAPSVVAKARKVGVRELVKASRLFVTKDLDNNRILKVRFFDSDNSRTGGYFEFDGNRKAAHKWFEIGMPSISRLKYRGGLVPGTERFSVQVYDGKWSLVDSSVLTTVTSNARPPRVETTNGAVTAYESIQIQNLFTARDPDGYDIIRYRIRDLGTRRNGGVFRVNGKRQKPGKPFLVGPDLLSRVRYHGAKIGAPGTSEKIEIQAYDGQNWSKKESLVIRTNANRRGFVISGRENVQLAVDDSVDISTFISWRDPERNTPKAFRFWDSGVLPDGGHFTYKGKKRVARKWFNVSADMLSEVSYQAASVRDGEKLRFQIFDGRYWSEVKTVLVRTIEEPIVIATPVIVLEHVTSVNARDVVLQNDRGPRIQKYQFMDINPFRTSAHLVLNGQRLQGKRIHEISRAQLRNLQIEGGKSDNARELDKMYVRGWNGEYWSSWSQFSVQTETHMLSAMESGASWFRTRPQAGTVTYSFALEVPFYYEPLQDVLPEWDERGSFRPLTPDQRRAMRYALDWWAQVTGLTFREVSDDVGGEIRIGQYSFDDAAAYAYFPSPDIGNASPQGDIWLAENQASNHDTSFGGFGILTYIHEIGHAIGLDHPFYLDGSDENPPYLPEQTDTNRYTTMSYTTNTDGPNPHPISPLLYDVAHAQSIYGPETRINRGDTVWRYDANERFVQILWDPDGHDTLNLFNFTANSKIDLRQGVWSNIGGRNQNFMIAYGTVIENAIAGSGNDIVNGNEVNNRIQGGRGKDRLSGAGGRDVLMGGAQSDRYVYNVGDGHDIIDEQRKGGVEVLEMRAITNEFNRLREDLTFRKIGNDLKIDLTLQRGRSVGSILIKNMGIAGSRVETLQLKRLNGTQIGEDIDLTSVWVQANATKQQFQPTGFRGQYGFLAVPTA